MNHQWKNYFKPWILERGRTYYRDNCVTKLIYTENEIQAKVEGSEEYCVEIQLSDGMPVDMFCDCPYADGGEKCKHMAAVLFAVEAKEYTFEENSEEEENDSEYDSLWAEAIEQLPEQTLRELLIEIAAEDGELQERLILLYSGQTPANAVFRWKEDLMEMVWEAEDEHEFVDYREAYGLMSDMADYMERRLQPMLDTGLVMEAYHLVATVLVTAADVDMDDSDGGLTMLTARCQDAWRKVFETASDAQRENLHQLFQVEIGCFEHDFIRDEVEDLFLDLEWDETLQQRNLVILDRKIAGCGKRDYRVCNYLKHRETIMRRLGASEEAVIGFWKAHIDQPIARERLLEIYLQTNVEEAVNMLKVCKELDQDTPHKLVQHSETLIRLYQEMGMQSQYEEELRFLVLHCRHIQVPYLRLLKDTVSSVEWKQIIENILATAKNWTERFTVLSFEGEYQLLLNEIRKLSCLRYLLDYEHDLKSWSAEQTMDCYAELLKAEMVKASNRKQYWSVIQHLKKISKYPNGKQAAQTLARYWKEYHYNRPAMKDELRKAGF